jgi:hypothetical protein
MDGVDEVVVRLLLGHGNDFFPPLGPLGRGRG